jgi:late competence protein required for DNA uptake (superfamily II DNA/RNA helicase)
VYIQSKKVRKKRVHSKMQRIPLTIVKNNRCAASSMAETIEITISCFYCHYCTDQSLLVHDDFRLTNLLRIVSKN